MTDKNPLIDSDNNYQSLHNIGCVISYLQEPRKNESELTDDIEYGLWLVLESIYNALEYEKERVMKMHVKAAPDA